MDHELVVPVEFISKRIIVRIKIKMNKTPIKVKGAFSVKFCCFQPLYVLS